MPVCAYKKTFLKDLAASPCHFSQNDMTWPVFFLVIKVQAYLQLAHAGAVPCQQGYKKRIRRR